MAKITFITGGQRSGKSSYAQKLVEEKSTNPIYLATSRIWDDDFKKRVERHQNERGEQWQTIEEEKHLSKHNLTGKTVLLDCITLWLNNIFFDQENKVKESLAEAKAEWDKLTEQNCELIVVSNEIGMGGHAGNEIGRKFTDLQGWMNQHIAQGADKVILMVSGIPLQVK